MDKAKKLGLIAVLQAAVLLYTLSSVTAKLAAGRPFGSPAFFALYGAFRKPDESRSGMGSAAQSAPAQHSAALSQRRTPSARGASSSAQARTACPSASSSPASRTSLPSPPHTAKIIKSTLLSRLILCALTLAGECIKML